MPDQNIALGVQVPDAMKSISGMLNFAGQAQQLRSAQQEYERGGIALEKEKATLPAAIAKFQAESEAARTGADKASLELQTRNADLARNTVAALRSNPAFLAGDEAAQTHILDSTEQYLNSQGLPTKKGGAVDQTRALIKARVGPQALDQHLLTYIQQGQSPEAKAGVVNAPLTPVSNGSATTFQQLQPGAPGAVQQGQQIQNTLPPGSVESIEVGPDKNQYVVTKSPQGTILSTRPLAGGPAGGTGGGAGMPKFSPGDAEAIAPMEGERIQARNSLSAAPIAHETNRGILREIDNVAATGQLGPVFQKFLSAAGAGFGTPEEKASAYDLIGKYMERNALEAAKAMGPGTNAGLEAAIKANGSVAYNPSAIKKITKLNDAIVSGAEAYQPGLEKAIAANPQRGVLAKREFDQAWAQNFDPRIAMLANAKKDGDRAEYESIVKSLGGTNSAAFKELAKKAANMDALTSQGRL